MDKAEVNEPMTEPFRPWNADRAMGKKQPLAKDQVGELYQILKKEGRIREVAMLAIAVDSMLRASDLLSLKVSTVRDSRGGMRERINFKQQKTKKRVVCALGETARREALAWISSQNLKEGDFLFPGKIEGRPLSRRQFQNIVKSWAKRLELPEENYGTHSLRRTKATQVFRKTLDPAKVQILLGQSTLAAAQSYLGVSEEEALKVAESIELF